MRMAGERAGDDGATVTRIPDGEPNLSECMERFAHHWLWVWIAGKWTDEQTCSTCGAIRTLTKAG